MQQNLKVTFQSVSDSSAHLSVDTKQSSAPCGPLRIFFLKCSFPLASVISYSLCFLSPLPSLYIFCQLLCRYPSPKCFFRLLSLALCFFASQLQILRYKCLQNFSTWMPCRLCRVKYPKQAINLAVPLPPQNNKHYDNNRNLSKLTSFFSSGISHFSEWLFSQFHKPSCVLFSHEGIAENTWILCPNLYYTSSVNPHTPTKPAQICYYNNLNIILTLFPLLIYFPCCKAK